MIFLTPQGNLAQGILLHFTTNVFLCFREVDLRINGIFLLSGFLFYLRKAICHTEAHTLKFQYSKNQFYHHKACLSVAQG